MEHLVTGDETTIFKKGSSLALRIPIFLFRQVFKSSRMNVFIQDDCIYLADAKYFTEDRGGEFRNTCGDKGIEINKITVTSMFKKLSIGEYDKVVTFSDFETYIKIKKYQE